MAPHKNEPLLNSGLKKHAKYVHILMIHVPQGEETAEDCRGVKAIIQQSGVMCLILSLMVHIGWEI